MSLRCEALMTSKNEFICPYAGRMLVEPPVQIASRTAFLLLLIMLLRPQFGSIHALRGHRWVSRDQSDLEFSGNGNQCCLELVVVNVVGVWWELLARHNFVRRQQPH
jgi:hypothetical protein